MKRILALTLLVPALALADESASAPAHTKVVGVILSTSQALVWDEDKNEYALRRVGDELVDGARIVALESDHVVVDRDGVRAEVEIGGAPLKAPTRRPRRMAPVIIGSLGQPEAPAAVAVAPAPVAAAPAPVAVAPAPVAAAPAPVAVAPAPVAVAPAPVAVPPPPVVVAPAPVAVAPAPVAVAPAPVAAAPAPPAIVVAAPPPAVAAAPPTAAAQTAEPQEGDEVEATVIPRVDLDRELGDFGALARQARVTAAPEGGFQLLQVRPGSFVSRVGLRRGDVIVRVDGRPINRAEDAAAAYAWLRVTDRFTVDVVRAGQPMRLHYVIAPTAPRATR
jgi:type II secretory pathway component PulC